MPAKATGLPIAVFLFLCSSALIPAVLFGQDRDRHRAGREVDRHHAGREVVVGHGWTLEADIIRARADAVLLLKQAELVGEKAYSQRLDNLMKECDVVYKRFSTRNEMRKEALENKYDRTFDIIRFNQELADIRGELEQKAVMQRTRIGDPTNEMNSLLEKFARQSITVAGIPAMQTELSPEQLDAIFLTDGSNTFSGKTGKTRLEAFKWPFLIQRKEFQEERDEFETQCDMAIKEINTNGSPSPETISDLLKQLDAIDTKLDGLPLSDSQNVRAVETKWRKEAKAFIRELMRTLGNTSKLDSEKLSKYVFRGKTLGELIDHLDSKGLRFSHPSEQDANLYASIFFIMRYAYEVGPGPLSAAARKHDEAEKQAIAAAKSWLGLTDLEKYGESWDSSADYLKNAVGKEDFVRSLTAARKPLGKLKSRELKSKEYRTSLPGAPDGKYVVIQFTTAFENKASAIETITPMLDKDGTWKVSGYYIK